MAIIITGKTRCAICDRALEEGEEIVSTSHFIADPQNPLWRFSDAGMHQTCFLHWDQRHEFRQTFNSIVGTYIWGNGTRHLMREDGRIDVVPAS